jgi:DNA polymerase III delta prime subunit
MSKMSVTAPLDFDLKYRPQTLAEVEGQSAAVAVVKAWKHVPRCVMLTGPTGTGKTSIARIIVKTKLDVGRMDLQEINCGEQESAIEMVREIGGAMSAAPMTGKHRVWILDECQTLSRMKFAQEALLKVLEECPSHVYFFLATTDPQRLLAAVRGRCEPVELKALSPTDLAKLVRRIADAEGLDPPLDDRLVDRIVDAADGAARNAVKLLQKVSGLTDPEARMAAVDRQGVTAAAFNLAQELLPFKGGAPSWPGVCKVLAAIRDEDPEGVRQVVLATARTWLIKPNSKLMEAAYKTIRNLEEPLYDKASGHALLAAACYRICFAR